MSDNPNADHRVPGYEHPGTNQPPSVPEVTLRCPECDTYSGTFTSFDDEVTHSTCGRNGPRAMFTRGSEEYAEVYDGLTEQCREEIAEGS
jgi:hypothetical protein